MTVREVEVKIKVENVETVISLLATKGIKFGELITQRDVVYIPHDAPGLPCRPGTNVLRIRQQGNKNLLTLKRSDVGNHLSKLEHELEIGDREQMDLIIRQLDFKLVSDITKTRCKAKIGEYELCADKIAGLGDYLEIEKMTEKSPAEAQKEMLEFLSQMGVDVSHREEFGYDVLYAQKFGLK